MRLLLTRGAEDSARTRAALEAAGHAVLVSPVIHFVPKPTDWPARPYECLVATSARAFSAIDMAAPPAGSRETMTLFVVGERTEAEARRHGFSGPATVAPHAAALATILSRQPKRTRMLYLAGVDRKADLEEALDASGHRLAVIETYAARAADALTPEAVAALRGGDIDAILHYSQRSAAIFLALAGAADLDVARLTHICLSADVKRALTGCADVRVADTPTDTAMHALLCDA